jgi:hypothetical protein
VRPWRVRLAVRRSRIQWAFLAVVLAVSVLSATLLSTLFLLASATQTFAARTALTDATAQEVGVAMRIEPNASLAEITEGTDETAEQLFGAVPFTREVTTQSVYLAIPRGDRPIALGYLGSTEALDSRVAIRTGVAPQPANGGPVQILVPGALLYDLDITLGDTITLSPNSARKETAEFTVVGTYAAKDLDDPAWLVDRFGGEGHNPNTVVPFSGGLVVTDGYGPLYTVAEDVETMPLDQVVATYVPDFSGSSLADVKAVLAKSSDLERIATRAIGDAATTVTVASDLDATLGGVAGSLAVTSSSVLVTGLLLLVLAIAALTQTARLMAERRYAEQHLMTARGGSGRQLFRLGFIEALALGVITTAVAAPLARLAYLALAETEVMTDAGMNVDPGIPPLTWVVAGIVGVILIAVLVAPLMKRQGTFVDAEQARSRPGRRAAFQRSGLDIAVLALAVLAYWQLKNYKSPVLSSGGVATVDPLLAAGPALALLAGALVAVRLIPPASKVLEALAARGRRAVMPLAAWEVGRRSARAVSAILLLTLAVSIGTFAITFLTTWQQSQDDQAQYQHPPDAIVSQLESPWLAQRTVVDGDGLATAESAVVDEAVKFGQTPEGFDRTDFSGVPMTLIATDTTGLKTYGVGRLNEIGGARIAETLGADVPAETNPILIPGKPQQLSMDVEATTSQFVGNVQLLLRGVIRNEAGDYQTLDFGQIPLDGEEYHLTAPLASTADLGNYSEPMYLVGLQAMWVSLNGPDEVITVDQTQPLAFTVSIDNVEAQVPVLAVPAPGVEGVVEATPLEIPADLEWTETNNGVGVDTVQPDGDQFHMRVITSASGVLRAPVSLVLTAAEKAFPLVVVANDRALKEAMIDANEPGTIQIGNALIPAIAEERVPAIAGETLGEAALVTNIARLQVATIQAGGDVLDPDEWWISVADEDLDRYAATLPAESELTAQAWLAEDLKHDPLRVAIQAALWLVTGAAIILAALGFAVHAIVTVRAREIELAQMRAIGVLRGQLLRIVATENTLLSALGLVFGVGLGIALSYLVAPLVSVGADGRPPLPPVVVEIPWAAVGLLAVEVALVLAVSVIIVAAMLRRIKPAEMLRLGDER